MEQTEQYIECKITPKNCTDPLYHNIETKGKAIICVTIVDDTDDGVETQTALVGSFSEQRIISAICSIVKTMGDAHPEVLGSLIVETSRAMLGVLIEQGLNQKHGDWPDIEN